MSSATHYTFTFWLVFDLYGKVRQTVREPGLSRTERKMLVTAHLPKSLWTSPTLRATITVTDDEHEPKFELDLTTAADSMREALGVDIDLRIVPPEPLDSDLDLIAAQDAADAAKYGG